MNLYGIIYLSVTKDEETYPCQHEKVFVTEAEREEAFEKLISEKWQEACNDDEDLDPERKDEFYDYDSWHYTNCYGDEYIVRKTEMEATIEDLEKALADAYRQDMCDNLQEYVPGYSSCRCALVDMRGMCLSFDCGDPRSKWYVDFIGLLPDCTQIVGGHTIKDEMTCTPNKYWYVFDGVKEDGTCAFRLGELKQLRDRMHDALKSNKQRKRAWNPFWAASTSVEGINKYLDTPYDEYLEDINNDKKHE